MNVEANITHRRFDSHSGYDCKSYTDLRRSCQPERSLYDGDPRANLFLYLQLRRHQRKQREYRSIQQYFDSTEPVSIFLQVQSINGRLCSAVVRQFNASGESSSRRSGWSNEL